MANTTTSQKPYQDKWLTVTIDTLASVDNPPHQYTYISRANPGVVVVPYDERHDSLILVSQYRHPIKKKVWQFLGGSKPKHQTFLQTAKQELLEETGYQASKLVSLGNYYPDVGIMSDKGMCYLALDLKQVQKPLNSDPNEQVRCKTFTLSSVRTMISDGTIRDGWTLSAFLLFLMWKEAHGRV